MQGPDAGAGVAGAPALVLRPLLLVLLCKLRLLLAVRLRAGMQGEPGKREQQPVSRSADEARAPHRISGQIRSLHLSLSASADKVQYM